MTRKTELGIPRDKERNYRKNIKEWLQRILLGTKDISKAIVRKILKDDGLTDWQADELIARAEEELKK